jgi:hypothetical protein
VLRVIRLTQHRKVDDIAVDEIVLAAEDKYNEEEYISPIRGPSQLSAWLLCSLSTPIACGRKHNLSFVRAWNKI